MEKLELFTVEQKWKEQLCAYKQEFKDRQEVMHGSAGFEAADDFDSWLRQEFKNRRKETVQAGLVPAIAYVCVRSCDQTLVGMIHIRLELNDYLRQEGGHIGYSIRASQRRKGYAKEMLRQACERCYEMGIQDILVTCDKENEASRKTILANGGILENEVEHQGAITQRYWIRNKG